MRYSVEHQRNIAYDLLEVKRNGYGIESYFEKSEPVIIYGFDFLAKEIYHEICEKVEILFFLDRGHDGEKYESTSIYSLDNDRILEIARGYKSITFLVSIVSDTEKIVKDTVSRIKNTHFVSLYTIFSTCKIKYNKAFVGKQNNETLSALRGAIARKKPKFKKIILVGTVYTLLLSMLYIEDWKNCLFVMERYISPSIIEKMKKMGLMLLYEEFPVEYYDLSYMLSDVAKEWSIPVWGHDHMNLSRAFVKNNINVLEDGLGNYGFQYNAQYNITLDEGRKYYPLGFDELVNTVILTGQFEIPAELLPKTRIVSLPSLWRKRNEIEKKEISDIMGVPYEDIVVQNNNGKRIVFLTEPNVSSGEMIMSVTEQIKLYRSILSHYLTDKVIIKPHPADTIDYSVHFSDCYILDKNFPVQFLDWFDIRIERFIIMKESSCLNLFKDKYTVDIYDGDILLEE